MRILALETSCDETAAAIVEDGRRVISSVIYTQNDLHARFGGVVPEAAARQHVETMNPCVAEALKEASMALDDVDVFAATLGPGLIGSLLIGANTAKTLSLITGKPFRGVNHLYAHVCSNFLESDLEPPFLCLLISGGHTQLIHVQGYDRMVILGETLDDAVGEAYDKIGRLMDIGFPGGPAIDKLAAEGNPQAFKLPIAQTQGPWDFSFSGLKTAAMRTYEKACATGQSQEDIHRDLAASFQYTVVETLFRKVIACADAHNLSVIAIAGGVSANRGIRARFAKFVDENPQYHLYIPAMKFCTDNAAMVASSAYFNPFTEDIGQEVFSRSPASVST